MKILKNLFQGYFKSDVWGNNRYSEEGYIIYPGVGKITDNDISDFTLKHLKFFDRFDAKKVAQAGVWSELFLEKCVEEPDKENWKY